MRLIKDKFNFCATQLATVAIGFLERLFSKLTPRFFKTIFLQSILGTELGENYNRDLCLSVFPHLCKLQGKNDDFDHLIALLAHMKDNKKILSIINRNKLGKLIGSFALCLIEASECNISLNKSKFTKQDWQSIAKAFSCNLLIISNKDENRYKVNMPIFQEDLVICVSGKYPSILYSQESARELAEGKLCLIIRSRHHK